MARGSKHGKHNTHGVTSQSELMRAKMALVAARERKEAGAFSAILSGYPAYMPELVEFDAALIATSGYEQEIPTRETESIAVRALARAMMTVFPAQAALPAPGTIRGVVVSTLRELRRSHGFSLPQLAERLGLGVDVLSSLEAGTVKVSSIPDRLVRALGDVFSSSLDQITDLLEMQVTGEPAWKRSTLEGSRKVDHERFERDFRDLVRTSPNMSPEQKAVWLDTEDS
ncbi:MAG: helix-turn-helix domain-containing protein [Ktedonobacterales bacterium]